MKAKALGNLDKIPLSTDKLRIICAVSTLCGLEGNYETHSLLGTKVEDHESWLYHPQRRVDCAHGGISDDHVLVQEMVGLQFNHNAGSDVRNSDRQHRERQWERGHHRVLAVFKHGSGAFDSRRSSHVSEASGPAWKCLMSTIRALFLFNFPAFRLLAIEP